MCATINLISNNVVTFKASGDVTVGIPVRPSSNYSVVACPANSPFIGITVNRSKDLLGVQVSGYFEMHYSSASPTIGFSRLTADGKGGVMVDTSNGRDCAIVYIDTATKTVGFIM